MPSLVVDLYISAPEFQRLYSGSANSVSCVSVEGVRVRFPAHVLRSFVTHEGVRGRFLLQFSPQHRFESLQRIE